MDDVQQIRKDIAGMEKQTSLRQIALQSGINYVTLRNIKSGKSKRVTKSVKDRFEAFKKQFDPGRFVAGSADAPTAAPKKRGRKPGRKAAAKKAATKKAAKKKPGPKPKKAAAKKATRKAAVKKAAAKKPGRKPGRKPGSAKKAVATKAAPSKLDFASPVLGQALDREIEIAEARLEYLKSLRDIESEFLKAVGRK